MAFEWDEVKRNANIAKHGIDFKIVHEFDFENAMEVEQLIGNEIRILAISPITNKVYALVYTMRGKTIRVISLRIATRREISAYVQFLS